MPPDEARDPAHLWDMLDYARMAVEIVQGTHYEAYRRDRVRQLALERALEVVGEAAKRVSPSFREAHPEIPWSRIIGQRNVLAHEYDEILHEELWKTATKRAPELIRMIEPMLPPQPESDANDIA